MKRLILSFFILGAVIGCTKNDPVINRVPGQGGIETPDPTPKPDPDGDASGFKICSFNIRLWKSSGETENHNWSDRKDGVFSFIRKEMPDMIGMMEIKFQQAEDIRAQLGANYEFYHINRDSGKSLTTSSGEAVGILTRKDRFKVLDKGFWWLHPTSQNSLPSDTGWGGACRRIVVWVKAKDLLHDGQTVWFFATHYDHQSSEAQENSTPICVKRFKEMTGVDNLKTGTDPIFFMGDLNAEYSSVCVQEMEKALWYSRLQLTGSATDGGPTFNGFTGASNKIIDHIFYGGPLKPVRYWVDRNNYCTTNPKTQYISDHYPVLFTCDYTK